MANGGNEAFSRILIDRELAFSGWDLLEFETGAIRNPYGDRPR